MKNHTVTRAYLAQWWSNNHASEAGIWYFDILTRQVIFSPSVKASFAIKRGLYTAPYGGVDDDRLENWFAASESQLCEFFRVADRPEKTPRPKVLHKALTSCISMGYRSEFILNGVSRAIAERNPDLPADAVRIAALNNLHAVVNSMVDLFTKGRLSIIYGIKKPLLTNDQPFWNMLPSGRSFAVFPLTPRCVLVFTPSADDFLLVVWQRAEADPETTDFVEFARLAAMRMARGWVVCPSEDEAHKVAAYLTEDTLKEAASTDRFLMVELPGRPTLLFDPASSA